MTKAHNLEDALLNLDPLESLKPSEREFFVERDHSDRADMVAQLRSAIRKQGYLKVLFTGHRGSGKGTELYRLNDELKDAFCIAHFSVAKVLDVGDLEYTDVIFAIGMSIIETAKNIKIANEIPDKLLEPIQNFFADVYQDKSYSEKYESGVEIKPSILNLLSAFGRLGTERESRTTVRKKLSGSLRALNQAIGDLARHIEQILNKRILVIVEDLDKLDEVKSKELFFQHGKSLSDPPVFLVYTFPVAFRHSQDFMQVGAFFPDSFDLPNIKTHSRDGQPFEHGLELLKQILTKRVAEGLFEPGTLELLAQKSGGLVRSLILLASKACLKAVSQKQTKVGLTHVEAAVKDLRADWKRVLTTAQLDLLRNINQSPDKNIGNSAEELGLLYNLSLLEYRNDDPDPWYDVHPIVQELLVSDGRGPAPQSPPNP